MISEANTIKEGNLWQGAERAELVHQAPATITDPDETHRSTLAVQRPSQMGRLRLDTTGS